jgi:DNA-directed RNA polymerase specialized sigma24 family protein
METSREVIERAFLTAHLLTANASLAEDITIQAIESWNPREESHELLFENVLEAALRAPVTTSADCTSSDQLNAVLLLAPRLRRCFVLRLLVGLSAQASAHMLGTSRKRVDDDTRLALQHLPANFKPEVIAA